ncbi:spore germination protein GerW family protein [Anaeromyxobacter oryzisoli]|uniref:spore germination protein GerW family protein n=1 Tax=Anaeromyxobacter oryzisoli TaxID=2925408 RepID=UPI001F586D12|nr:spore germination protein GerW family protein [Anaeromyxobacter sp. SG63]
MDVQALVAQTRDALSVKRVFGDPIQQGDVTLIPVAIVGGGAGGGGGAGPSGQGSGEGGGFGVSARPAGVYVVKHGEVSWRPAVDVNRIVLGMQIVCAIGLLALLRGLRRR